MKKLLAILLVLTMVLPMCVVANAAETSVEIKPFNISTSLKEGFDNIWPKIHFWSQKSSAYVSEDDIRVTASSSGVKGTTPKEIAENLKPVFDQYPEGMRYIRFSSFRAALLTLLEDYIYMDKGAAVIQAWFEEFIKHYHDIGGKIDGLSVDIEYVEGGTYYLTQDARKDPLVYKKIVENPNYKTRIRPALKERGFKFWDKISDETPEIYSINDKSGDQYAESRAIWNVVVRNHISQYVTDSVLKPLQKYYSEAQVFDYQSRTTYSWQKTPGDQGDLTIGGNYIVAGNVNYFNTYASRPGTGFFGESGEPRYVNIPSYNGASYGDNPFNMVKFETIFAKNLKASAPDGKLTAIVAFYNYSTRAGSYGNKPYYSESFYHTALLDPDPLAGYIEENEVVDKGNDVHETMQVVSELLDELTRICGAADRKPLELPYTWNDAFILSGMYAGGKNYYRLTPDTTGGKKLEDFKVAGAKDLTFTHEGQTITFPGGKIIQDAKISKVGTCGFWIETAKDVLPVVTYSENRYSEFPAFLETYESYKTGEDLDITNAYPAGRWEVKKSSNSSAKIADDSGNKALAMSGTYSLRLRDIMKNITAGDTYAKNQAWQIDVKVPANMGADSEIILLNIFSDKSKAAEGGFKIADGKVYYDQAGEYVELTGVDVSKGGKFTLKRNFDFNNVEAPTCDYFVYDASGKLLGEAKAVSMASIKLPVERIALSVTKISGDAVLLDNFKMYATGVGADLELYDAKTGMQYTELDKARDKDTAYRFSWMNATSSEKVYSIIAAYYKGDKLVSEKVIEEIKMAPSTDYVATGIVKLDAEGQTVRIYARDDSKEGGNANSEDTMLLIIIIAAAVVLVALVVVAVVVLTKKTPEAVEEKKEESEDETAEAEVEKEDAEDETAE